MWAAAPLSSAAVTRTSWIWPAATGGDQSALFSSTFAASMGAPSAAGAPAPLAAVVITLNATTARASGKLTPEAAVRANCLQESVSSCSTRAASSWGVQATSALTSSGGYAGGTPGSSLTLPASVPRPQCEWPWKLLWNWRSLCQVGCAHSSQR